MHSSRQNAFFSYSSFFLISPWKHMLWVLIRRALLHKITLDSNMFRWRNKKTFPGIPFYLKLWKWHTSYKWKQEFNKQHLLDTSHTETKNVMERWTYGWRDTKTVSSSQTQFAGYKYYIWFYASIAPNIPSIGLNKGGYQVNSFLISWWKYMLWVLIRSASVRRF